MISGPVVSLRTFLPRKTKSLKVIVLRKAWLGFLAITLILSPIAGILWNPQHNIALADTAVYGFAKGMGGTGSDQGYHMVVDSDNNSFITGVFSGTADFDPGAGTSNLVSAGSTDIFVVKLDSDGDLVWAKGMGGTSIDTAESITLDTDGNIHVAGVFRNTVDFDPGAGTSNLVAVASWDAFILKLDSDGDFVWAKAFSGESTDYANDVAVDGLGNVYVTGYYNDVTDFDPDAVATYFLTSESFSNDIFVAKLDSSGTFVWAKSMNGGTGSDSGNEVRIDSDNNVYTVGSFRSTVDFDPGAGTFNLISASGASTNGYISKLDSDGDFVWAKLISAADSSSVVSVAVSDSADVHITGNFRGTVDFDPGVGTSNLTSGANSDIFVSKLDSDGNLVWAKGMNGAGFESGLDINLDGDDNVYSTGYFVETVDFDPGAGTSNLVSAGGSDIFVSKLDSDGDFVLASRIGGTGSDLSYSVALDSSNNILITGYFAGTADFDPGAGTSNLTSAGSSDIFVSKLSQVSSPTITSSAASEISKEEAVLNGNITSTGGADATERGFEYGLTNSYGTTITQSSGPYSTGAFSGQLTDLTCSTVYYFRSYATNPGGTSYGSETTFTTSNCSSSGSSSSSSSQSNTQTPTTAPTDTPQTPETPTTQPTFTIPSSGPSGNPSGGQIRSKEGLLPPSLLFTRNLGPGSVGTDVQRLQQFMNTNSYSVSTTGAGATNQETTFFGPRTRAAVKVFQEAFAAEILTPLGLTQGTGYFGSSTRAMLNSLIK